MPIHKEDGGEQWGNHGKVYHGPDAKKKAEAQAAAAHANGYTGDKLEAGSSAEVISRNIKALRDRGYKESEAIAIAYAESKKSKAADAAPFAAGVLYREKDSGHILLLRRAGGDNQGTWSYPAGHVDPGENAQQAAMREFEEETGGKLLRAPQPLGVYNGFALYGASGDLFRPELNEESMGYTWARPDEIAQGLPAPLHPGIQEQMKDGTLDRAQAMDERIIDTNGWPEIRDNPLSKVGVFAYSGRVLPGAADPDKMYMVYRPAAELADPETVASFKLVPWIDNHTMLGEEESGMTPAEQKGVQGVVGEDVYFAETEQFPDGALFGNIKVFSESMKNLIDAGKEELSCGYRCKYEWEAGEFNGQHYELIQRQIRGNHLALVNQGRMGPDVSVLDHLTFTIDSKDIIMADENGKEEGGAEEMSLAEMSAAIKTLLPLVEAVGELRDKLNGGGSEEEIVPPGDEKEDGVKDGEGKDAEPEKKDDDKDEDKDKGMDAAEVRRQVFAEIGQRDKLYQRVSVHVGAFDHAEMSADQVAAYACKKLGLTAPKGHEQMYLNAYLDGRGAASKQHTAQDKADGSKGGANPFVARLSGE